MILHLDNVGSTNSYVSANADRLAHGDAVEAAEQTAGRGQRGNSWESEPGANVTMSILLRPAEAGVPIHAARSFPLSEAVALAVADVVGSCLPAQLTDQVAIKWPNDIYVGDKKIAGILIENSLVGPMIGRSIVGIGINVNQRRFLSDAPNPVSMVGLGAPEQQPEAIARLTVESLLVRFEMISSDPEALHRDYIDRLWRRGGVHPFVDCQTGQPFDAEIISVAPTGHITLRHHPSGNRHVYAFKEISWTL